MFCTSLVLYTSSILPFDSRLHSVLPISRNPSLEFRLLSPIQRINQNDRCIPLLLQCSVTLKQNMNPYSKPCSLSLTLFLFFNFFSIRPLVKMSITWRKDGLVVNTGIRDFGRRLVISLPAISDSGYYECEASLRSSSVPSITAGAFLHVLGK